MNKLLTYIKTNSADLFAVGFGIMVLLVVILDLVLTDAQKMLPIWELF